jgi:MOSC domain-containing protein YiiM
VVALGSADLLATIGSGLRVGEVELDVTSTARDCPGVYAAVRRPGTARVGDLVEVVEGVAPGGPQSGAADLDD